MRIYIKIVSLDLSKNILAKLTKSAISSVAELAKTLRAARRLPFGERV
jgi:hypothetical protein